MFPNIETTLKNLGITNYAIYGDPSNETEFYQFIKPVIGVDHTSTNIFADKPEDYTITYQQFVVEYNKVKAEVIANMYKGQRKVEYPAIGDQLDALFHAGVFPPEMAAQIQAVKDKYPKGS